MVRNKFIGAKEAGADCFITICPFCAVQLDVMQMKVEQKYNENRAFSKRDKARRNNRNKY